MDEYEKAHNEYRQIVQKCIRIKEKQDELIESITKNNKEIEIRVCVAGTYGNMYPYKASPKQIEFARNLLNTLKEKGIVFDKAETATVTLNMYTINYFIRLYKILDELAQPPEGYEYFVIIKQFMAELAEIKPPISADKEIRCTYTLRKCHAVFEEVI